MGEMWPVFMIGIGVCLNLTLLSFLNGERRGNSALRIVSGMALFALGTAMGGL